MKTHRLNLPWWLHGPQVWFLLASLLGLCVASWGQSPAAWLSAQAPPGFCARPHFPVGITFTGGVRTFVPLPLPGQPRPTHYALTYRWVRSDGTQGPWQTFFFTQAGVTVTQAFANQWTVNRPLAGSEWLQISGQPPVQSPAASFNLLCPQLLTPSSGGSLRPVPAALLQLSLAAQVPAGFCHHPHFPVSVAFHGAIRGPALHTPVQYRMVRSDGALGPLQTVNFSFGGTQAVAVSWTLWRAISGWEAIEVLAPSPERSAPARFDLHCR
jgi:hypothetical protein